MKTNEINEKRDQRGATCSPMVSFLSFLRKGQCASSECALGDQHNSFGRPMGIQWENNYSTRVKYGSNTGEIRVNYGFARQFVYRVAAMLLMLVTMSVGQVWGAVANISFAAKNSTETATVNGVTVSFSNTSNGQTGYYKVAKGETFTLSCSANIKTVLITYSAQDYSPSKSGYADGLLTTNVGTLNAKASTTTSTWVGSAKSITFTDDGVNGKDFRIASIVVTTDATGYYYRGNQNRWGATAMTVSADGYYEYISAKSYANNGNANNLFKIALSKDGWDYNWTYADKSGFHGTDITNMWEDSPSKDHNVGIHHTTDYYVLVYYPNTAINTSNNPIICASTTLPNDAPAAQYTGLSASADPAAGGIPSISATSCNQGSSVTVNAHTNSGYNFSGWTSTAGTFGNTSNEETTFTPSANNAVAIAHYTAKPVCTEQILRVYSEIGTPRIYIWNAAGVTGNGGGWPGTNMTAIPGATNWYQYDLGKNPTDGNYILSVDSKGQTGDLDFSNDVPCNCYQYTYSNNNGHITVKECPVIIPTYAVTIAPNNAGYGSVDVTSIADVEEGTSISKSGNKLTVGSTVVTATPAAQTAQYTYTFSDWSWTPAGATISAATSVTATFTRTTRKYTVTFNSKGGSAVDPQEVDYNGHPTAPSAPTKSGYTFDGWSETDGGAVVDVTTLTITAAKTLYAKWSPAASLVAVSTNTEFNFSVGTWTPGSVSNNMEIGSNCSLSDNNKSIDGYSFTKRLQLGGDLSATRYVAIRVAGPCAITVYGMSGQSRDTRSLKVVSGSIGGTVLSSSLLSNDGNAIGKDTYDYTGSEETLYIGSANSGFNIYMVKVTFGAPAPTTYTVTANDPETSCDRVVNDVREGQTVTITNVCSAPGKHLTGYSAKKTDDDTPIELANATGTTTFSFTMPAYDVTLTAVWANDVYYLKHPWGGGGDWTWKPLTANGDGTYSITDILGNKSYTVCNWGTDGSSSKGDLTEANITWVGNPSVGDRCTFMYNPETNKLTITKVVAIYHIYLGQTLTLPEGVVATYDASDEVNNVPAYYYDNLYETTKQYSRTGALTIANGNEVTGHTLGKYKLTLTSGSVDAITVYVYRYYAKYPWGACNLEPAEDYNKAWKWQAMANPAGDNLQVVGLYSHAVDHHANVAWDYAYDWDGLYKYDGSGTPDLHPGLDESRNQGKWIDGTNVTSGGSVYKEIPHPSPELNCAGGDYIELDYAPGTLTGPDEPSLSTNFTTQNGGTVAAGFRTLTYVAVPAEGGVITHNASADKVAQGTKVTFHAETNSGYHFIGWYRDAECTSEITGASVNAVKQSHLATVDANYAVYAKFMPHVTGLTVTAENDKTTLIKSETVQLTAVFTPDGALPADKVVTWSSANSTLVSVSSTGMVTASGATNGTVITARSANGIEGTITIVVVENCDSWMISYWNTAVGYEYSGRACFSKLYPDNDNDHEWRTDNTFVLKAPSGNDKFWVGEGSYTQYSRNWTTSQLTTVGLQSNNKATNYYPGQDAIGYLRIFDNSTEDNYYVAFEPTYQVLYGVTGSSTPWAVMDFHNVSGHEYETDLLTAPSGYKNNDNFQYFVGTKRVNERSQFVDEKSRYDKLNDVNGLSSSDMAGKYGKFHIWGNSPDKNWFCEFIPYYVVELYDRDVKYGETQSSLASTPRTVTFSALAARTGYTFDGWRRADGTLTITESMPEWTNYAMRTSYERFNSVWTPNNYTITLDNQSATTAGTTNVTATYDANTNLTSAITIPKKDDAAFDGYYTSLAGAGVQLIDAYGNFIAGVEGYTDALGNWIHADDVTLYAKWVNTCDEILGTSSDYTAGSNADRKVYTFGNGAKIYSVNSKFEPQKDERIKAGTAAVKECSGNESIFAFNQRYLVLQFPVDVADITLYAYNSGSVRNVESVKVANAAALLPASPSFSAIDIDVIPNTMKGCQVLNAAFRQPVAANKFIAVDLGGSADIYRICYTPANAKATQPILPALTDLNANAGTDVAWNATIVNAGSLQGGETVTYSWTNEDGDEIATTATLNLNNLNMSQSGKYTVTATVHADGLKDAVATKTLTLTVVCPDVKPEVYEVSSNTESQTFGVRRSDNQAAYSTGSFQWYKDDALIPGATSTTYTAWQTGHYYVEYINYCSTKSDNYGDFTAAPNAPVATRLAPFQYCHKGRTYIEKRRLVHLFYVKSSGTGAFEGKYQITATKNSSPIALPTNAIVEEVSGEGKNLLLDLNVMAAQGTYAVDDVITITVVPYLNTNALSAVIRASIDVKIIADATPTLAFIVSGTDIAAGTKNKKSHTVGGDFLTAANRADLCVQTGITSFDSDRELPLYTALRSNFLVTPVNGYADFNLYNYEPFDLVFLTDFPKTDVAKTNLDDLAQLVDYRPMFSTKAYMSGLSKWKALGITANPKDPKQTQKWMNITCSSHTMFAGIDFAHDVPVETGSNEYVFTMLDAAGFDNGKALQGFDLSQVGRDFTKVATTHNDATARIEGKVVTPENIGPEDKLLVVSMERQLVMDARLLMLVLNADAHSQLSTQGINVIVSALKYLLITNEDAIDDCSKIFEGTTDQYWDEATNWFNNEKPTIKDKVRILADCVVRTADAAASTVSICTGSSHNGHLTIQPTGALQVTEAVKRVEDGHYFRPMPTTVNDIYIQSSATGNGALIHGDKEGQTGATVEMYSKASGELQSDGGMTNVTWQWMTTPYNDVRDAQYNYYGGWLYEWQNETKTWLQINNGDGMTPFRGYMVTHSEANHVYWMQGTLTTTEDPTLTATYKGNRAYLFGNSWTAPIQIANFEDGDFENLVKTIVLFNTGNNTTGVQTASAQNETAGQYVSIPVSQASSLGDAYKVIPSMQAFQIRALRSTDPAKTASGKINLTLDYDRLVRPTAGSVQINPMRAPGRVIESEEEELHNGNTAKLVISVKGEQYADRMFLFANPSCTDGFDNGWDGAKVIGESYAPQLYVENEAGSWAVSSQPELPGTTLVFRKGTDSHYTIRFEYIGEEELALYDAETGIYTPITNQAEYEFESSNTEASARFAIVRYVPQVPTDIENGSGGSGRLVKKMILNNMLYISVDGILYNVNGKVVR